MNRIILVLGLLLMATGARAQHITTDSTLTQNDSATHENHGEHEHHDDEKEELEEITVSTTRSTRTIANLPTRVEVIGGEEVDEKINMRPANVTMLLHESTGIQVQQTSATSANASIRLQGLDGRYTQLLKDGYPNFGNFAGGLSILELPPLDLKQVEIIKGPASTLYGAGAIAGVINFVSRTPTMTPLYTAIVNQSHVGQTNVGGFAAQRGKKFGYTLLALANKQLPYDVDGDGFTELPKSTDFTLHPRLFFYPKEGTILSLGNSFTKGDREGGDISLIENGASAGHTYFENNHTLRNVTTLEASTRLKNGDKLEWKNSYSYFNRLIQTTGYEFEGNSGNLFSELTYARTRGVHTMIGGINFISDNFQEEKRSTALLRDFQTTTAGIFAQHTWDATNWLKLESGLRVDAVHYGNDFYSKTEMLPLPRISALFIWNRKLSSRIGGGLGYKTPTLFTEETESFQYQHLLPLNGVESERSLGATADLNYRTEMGEDWNFSLNHMFFVTRIQNPSVLSADSEGDFFFANASLPVISKGFETNLKIIFRHEFKLFAGYTFTDAEGRYLNGVQTLPLQPKNKLNLALIWERHGWGKAGLEGYFTDRQYRSDQTRTPSYWEFGAMVEKTFGIISIYVNAENFTDTRQSRYRPVVHGLHTAPSFDEIWTHTEGFVLSGGIKLKI